MSTRIKSKAPNAIYVVSLLLSLSQLACADEAVEQAILISDHRRLKKTPDTRAHPGIVDLPLPEANTTLHLIRCRNYASAYSAAWLAPKDYVLKTSFANRLTLEWHSHNLYQANQAGSYKIEEHENFFVNHLSEFEHSLVRHKFGGGEGGQLSAAAKAKVAELVEAEHKRTCGAPSSMTAPRSKVESRHHSETAGVM